MFHVKHFRLIFGFAVLHPSVIDLPDYAPLGVRRKARRSHFRRRFSSAPNGTLISVKGRDVAQSYMIQFVGLLYTLLADAEFAEECVEHVLGADDAGDRAERVGGRHHVHRDDLRRHR